MRRSLTHFPTSVADEFAELIERVNAAINELSSHNNVQVNDSSLTEQMRQRRVQLYAECLEIREQLSVSDPACRYTFIAQTDLIDRTMSAMNQVEALRHPTQV